MIENLVPDYPYHLEALLAPNRVDQHVAMNTDKVFRVKDTVLILDSKVSCTRPDIFVLGRILPGLLYL